ncbi:MAG: AzlC family ABC transporter permease, partial [Lachnospiraceae bacterium]
MSLSMSQKVEERKTTTDRLAVSYGITDEIFAVAMKHPGVLTTVYMAGLIIGPVLGWSLGTLTGGAVTKLLPEEISNALGIALYGMFIAVVIPAAKQSKAILFTVILAVLCSTIIYYTPALAFLSGGWGIIVVTLIASGAAAILFPIHEGTESKEEEPS